MPHEIAKPNSPKANPDLHVDFHHRTFSQRRNCHSVANGTGWPGPVHERGISRAFSVGASLGSVALESAIRPARNKRQTSVSLLRHGLAGVRPFCDCDCLCWRAARSGAKPLVVHLWNDCVWIVDSLCVCFRRRAGDSDLVAIDRLLVRNSWLHPALALSPLVRPIGK